MNHSFDMEDGYCHTHRQHCSMVNNRQITEKLDADGIEYSFGTDEYGAIRIIVNGESLSPGQAADKFLKKGNFPS